MGLVITEKGHQRETDIKVQTHYCAAEKTTELELYHYALPYYCTKQLETLTNINPLQ